MWVIGVDAERLTDYYYYATAGGAKIWVSPSLSYFVSVSPISLSGRNT